MSLNRFVFSWIERMYIDRREKNERNIYLKSKLTLSSVVMDDEVVYMWVLSG